MFAICSVSVPRVKEGSFSMKSSAVTRFVAKYAKGALIDCLCFGMPATQHQTRARETVYHFRPGQLFAIIRWRRHSEDRQHRSLTIVEATADPAPGHKLPGVHPPPIVHAMVDQHGPAGQGGAVDLLLDLIQDMKSRGDQPADYPADYWRKAAHRIMLCEPPLEAGAGEFLA
jgi:hypothetical protein